MSQVDKLKGIQKISKDSYIVLDAGKGVYIAAGEPSPGQELAPSTLTTTTGNIVVNCPNGEFITNQKNTSSTISSNSTIHIHNDAKTTIHGNSTTTTHGNSSSVTYKSVNSVLLGGTESVVVGESSSGILGNLVSVVAGAQENLFVGFLLNLILSATVTESAGPNFGSCPIEFKDVKAVLNKHNVTIENANTRVVATEGVFIIS